MAYELKVPVGRAALWPAFTDPESMARAVPGLTVDAVQPVDPAGGPAGVSADVVAGRLRLKVGAGTVTYRGTATIADADPAEGTLDIAIDVAQARGSGALAGYLRLALTPDADGTLVSVVPDLELSGRVAEFRPEDLREAVGALAAAWVTELAGRIDGVSGGGVVADGAVVDGEVAAAAAGAEPTPVEPTEPTPAEAEPPTEAAPAETEPEVAVSEPEVAAESVVQQAPEPDVAPPMKSELVAELEAAVAETEAAAGSEPADTAEPESAEFEQPADEPAREPARETTPEAAPETAPEAVPEVAAPLLDDSLSDDPLDPVWRGEYEKNPWIPVIAVLTALMILRRRRRKRRPMS